MKTKLLLGLILLFVHNFSIAQIPQQGIVGMYKFSNDGLDSSPKKQHAQIVGGEYVADRFGKVKSALKLNGKTDSIVLPITEFAPIKGDFTISLWVKINTPEQLNLISIKQFGLDTTSNFEVQLNGDNMFAKQNYSLYAYWNGSGRAGDYLRMGIPNRINDNKWYNVVVRRSQDTLEFYINRAIQVQGICKGQLGDNLPLVIGAGLNRFRGVIDDISLYNKAITEDELIQLYHDNQPYVITSPKKTDAYVQNDEALFSWNYDPSKVSDSVQLYYKMNSDTKWTKIMNHDNMVWSYYTMPLAGYTYGTKISLRIEDFYDSTKYAEVGPFTMSDYKWDLVLNSHSNIVSNGYKLTPRDGCGLLNFKGKMWLIGGWDPPYHVNEVHNEVWTSTDGINWVFEDTADWSPRHISGWLVHDSAIFVIGGDPQSGGPRDVWKSEDGLNWTKLHDTIPNFTARVLHMVASMNGFIYVYGGSSGVAHLSDVWRSKDGIDWERLPDAPWPGRGQVLGKCVQNDTTLWMFGGGRMVDIRNFNDVWKTNDGINWTLVNPSAEWSPRNWHTMEYYDNKLWSINGYTDTDDNEVWYSSNGIEWFELKNSPFIGRHAHSSTIYNGYLWMGFGIGTPDIWRLKNNNPKASLAEISKDKNVKVFPNPTSEEIHINGLAKNTNYLITNMEGKVVQVGTTTGKIQVNRLGKGTYFVKVNDEQIKFIVY